MEIFLPNVPTDPKWISLAVPQEILDQAAKSRKPIHQDQAVTLVVIELCSRFFLWWLNMRWTK